MNENIEEDLAQEIEEQHQYIVKLEAGLRQCRDAMQGYKDTNKLHPASVLARALDNAKILLNP